MLQSGWVNNWRVGLRGQWLMGRALLRGPCQVYCRGLSLNLSVSTSLSVAWQRHWCAGSLSSQNRSTEGHTREEREMQVLQLGRKHLQWAGGSRGAALLTSTWGARWQQDGHEPAVLFLLLFRRQCAILGPPNRQDADKLKQVQKRATKAVGARALL